jgi:hypothetical protein
MDAAWLMWSGLFSIIGLAVFTYGRRQQVAAPTLIGIALMVYPYFVSNTYVMVGVGVLLIGGLFIGSRLEGL